jgi:hypothetical protein
MKVSKFTSPDARAEAYIVHDDAETYRLQTYVPITVEEFRQSLSRAKEEGLAVFYDQEGRGYVTSGSRDELVYRVDFAGCECLSFTHRGRCAHYAAILDAACNAVNSDVEKL